MSFPLTELPVELGVGIIEQAVTTTGYASGTEERNQVYRNACALAYVSTWMRELVMPHLLHTIILPSEQAVVLFLQAIETQEIFSKTKSRLQIDYRKYIRRFWCTEFQLPAPNDNAPNVIDYHRLLKILPSVQDVGFHFDSIHLLAEVLDVNKDRSWEPTEMTFGGSPRWNRLISSSVGAAFLNGLTHLSVLDLVKQPNPSPALAAQNRYRIPDWAKTVPFKYMRNFRHFAFTVVDCHGGNGGQIPIAVYSLPSDPASTGEAEHGGLAIQQCITSDDPFAHNCVRLIHDSGLVWYDERTREYRVLEAAFERGENGFRVGGFQ